HVDGTLSAHAGADAGGPGSGLEAARVGRAAGLAVRHHGGAAASLYWRAGLSVAAHLESRGVRSGGAGIHRPALPRERLLRLRPDFASWRATVGATRRDDRGMSELIVGSEPGKLVRQAAEWLAREVTKAITERGSCGLCLAGGRTPQPVYRALASETSIGWERLDVFFSDERAVPPDHPDSNYLMVYQAPLSRVPVPPARARRMEAERPAREAAPRDYERSLPPRLDVLVLGIGPDGY